MSNPRKVWFAVLSVTLALSVADFALAQEAHPSGQNVSEMKFVMFPGTPTCVSGSVVSGDPSKGPSIFLAKAKAGCAFPWHWHTPNENLMIVTGTARLEPKGGKASTLRAGAFAMMPSKHVHRFRCPVACSLYVYSDAPFDIHYVNAQGAEISPDDALKAVKETAAKAEK